MTGQPDPPLPWIARLATIEAMTALMVARLLVATVRFGRWRALLGTPCAVEAAYTDIASWRDHYYARVVERAAQHLPFETLCLPRAMALKWMLMRRGRPVHLVLAVLPGGKRGGTLDDLHAWAEVGKTVLIGDNGQAYREIARFL